MAPNVCDFARIPDKFASNYFVFDGVGFRGSVDEKFCIWRRLSRNLIWWEKYLLYSRILRFTKNRYLNFLRNFLNGMAETIEKKVELAFHGVKNTKLFAHHFRLNTSLKSK